MTPEQIEQRLKDLGAATAPKDSLVSRVMERVNALDDPRQMVIVNRFPKSRRSIKRLWCGSPDLHVQASTPAPQSPNRARLFRSALLFRSAAVLTAIAASVGVVLSIRSIINSHPTSPVVINPGNPTHPARSETDSILRLADYRRASTKSADAFEAMLREPPVPSPGVEPEIRAGDVSRAELNLN